MLGSGGNSSLEVTPIKSPPRPKPLALRIELLGIEPLIWRRIVVSNQTTLAALHNYLQWVMGWQDSHAHEFQLGEEIIAPDWWIQETAGDRPGVTLKDEKRVSVAWVLAQLHVGGEFFYVYDMGDDWQHRIVVEAPPKIWVENDLPLPTCTAGENACPPEDIGGPLGYERFLAALADTASEDHIDMVRWSGGVFDPRGFDLNRINRDWRTSKRRR